MIIRFDRSTIRKGLRFSLALSILSVTVIFFWTKPGEAAAAFKQLKPLYLVLAVVLAGLDWLGGGLRLYVLTRRITREISYSTCFQSALCNTFMGAVTPSQTGGGPAQIYILYKAGMPVTTAMSVSFITFLGTVIFMVLTTGTITVLGLETTAGNMSIRALFRYGVSVFLVIGLLVILFVSRPDLLRRSMQGFFNFISRFRKRHFLHPGGRALRVIDQVDHVHQILLYYLRYQWFAVIQVVLVTGLVFLAKFSVAYFIVRGLGVEAGLWEVYSIQILIFLAIYFSPTPGASGVAELGSAVLMASILPVELLTVYVVLWRAILTYLAVLVGSFIMLRAIGRDTVTLEGGLSQFEKKVAVSGEEA